MFRSRQKGATIGYMDLLHTKRELLGGSPKSDLGKDLVGERTGHDEGWVAGGTARNGGLISQDQVLNRWALYVPKVDKTALSKKDDVATVRHGEAVNLGLDVDAFLGVGLQPGNIDLDVEVTNAGTGISILPMLLYATQHSLADNSILWHDREVSASDDIPVASGGDEEVGSRGSIFHSGDLITSHGSLKGVDRVDLSNQDTSTIGAERLGALKKSPNQQQRRLCQDRDLHPCRHHRSQQQRQPCQPA